MCHYSISLCISACCAIEGGVVLCTWLIAKPKRADEKRTNSIRLIASSFSFRVHIIMSGKVRTYELTKKRKTGRSGHVQYKKERFVWPWQG